MRAAIRRLVAAALTLACTVATAQTELPSMGDPADQILSPSQEAAIGREMLARARQQLDLNSDPQVAAYINSIGQRLARHTDNRPRNGFHFFVVHAPSINAFAVPGGYIGIHSGLIRQADSEAQVAGVLAHEIAHVTQRHIARAYAAAQGGSYGMLAAVLAGLILSSQNPEAGQAAITTGIAAEQQRRINYTRSNEYEADRIGIGLLARAGYHPDGMAGMFELLQRAGGASTTPEFLRTHPLSGNRIAEARNRAASISAEGKTQDTLEFHLMRTRLEVLEAGEPETLYNRWDGDSMPDGEYAAAARAYGLALLETETGQPKAAIERLRKLRTDAPDNRHYGLALIAAHRAVGDLDQALSIWNEISALHPDSYAVIAAGSELYVAQDQPSEAVTLVTDYVRRVDDPPAEAWRQIAHAAEAAGRPARSHEALGEYYARTDQYDRAMEQIELARRNVESGSSNDLRLEARLEQLRELKRQRMAETRNAGR